ncbi:MAG TPA: hypothetical protein VMC79_00535, partial [Rectinemataceae bacterium]|nr:hypothetical protein [Rectinemataceae bacterium]
MAAFAFGQGMSVGGGVAFDPTWMTMRFTQGSTWTQSESAVSVFGASAFFDATYVQASVGFLTNSKNYTDYGSDSTGGTSSTSYSDLNVGTWISL